MQAIKSMKWICVKEEENLQTAAIFKATLVHQHCDNGNKRESATTLQWKNRQLHAICDNMAMSESRTSVASADAES